MLSSGRKGHTLAFLEALVGFVSERSRGKACHSEGPDCDIKMYWGTRGQSLGWPTECRWLPRGLDKNTSWKLVLNRRQLWNEHEGHRRAYWQSHHSAEIAPNSLRLNQRTVSTEPKQGVLDTIVKCSKWLSESVGGGEDRKTGISVDVIGNYQQNLIRRKLEQPV